MKKMKTVFGSNWKKTIDSKYKKNKKIGEKMKNDTRTFKKYQIWTFATDYGHWKSIAFTAKNQDMEKMIILINAEIKYENHLITKY